MKYRQIKQREVYEQISGFTLVETLVAISILLLVIIGPMTIAAKGMKMGFYANEQITAVFLAQEAIESIQKLRDDNALALLENPPTSANAWDWFGETANGFDNCLTANGCDLDILNTEYIACGLNGSGCLLGQGGGSIEYGYGGSFSESSLYTRVIKVVPVTIGPDIVAADVTVTVSWSAHLYSDLADPIRTVTLQTYVYNHYKHYQP